MVEKLQMSHMELNWMLNHLSLIAYGNKGRPEKEHAGVERSEKFEGHTIL